MKVELLTLCDYAVAVPGGKLTIVGTFDRLFATQFPFQQPPFYLVGKFRFDASEVGEKRLRFSVSDPDGREIGALPELKVPVRMREDEYTTAMQVVLRINGLPLAQEGEHSVIFAVDGRIESSLPLSIKLEKKPG